MEQIFISYSRRNLETVNQFAGALEKAGVNLWIDREEIKAGNSWRVQIVQAIDTCNAFVLMLSGDSALSPNVHKEVILAAESGRPIFVVMLEPVKPPAEIRYQLAGLQYVDVQALGFDKAVQQLLAALQEYLKKKKAERSRDQAELVIQGITLSDFGAEKQEQLLAFISNLAGADRSQLKIRNLTAGSVHVFMQMPVGTAFALKTLALNRDRRFRQLGISALRLAGDPSFIQISLGVFTAAATLGFLHSLWIRTPSFLSMTLGVVTGKLLTLFALLALVTGLAFFASSRTPNLPLPSSTSTLTITPPPSATETRTPTTTASPTETPTPVYQVLSAVVTQHIACRYGPGDLYLIEFGLIEGNKMKVTGRDVNSGWGYAQVDGYENPCWVNFKYIKLDGEVSSLEPVYPGKVGPPLSFLWPMPSNVTAVRTKEGNQVAIYWDEYLLPLGERESADSPRYLAELWLCKDGVLTFGTFGMMQNNLLVTDEAGCLEPSHGVIYLAEKHGYAGPVEIPWPPHTP
ncbi:MAG: toll/interleukin-1 receptor domain-containing protein [Chloroflexi bacterium]|nr:toll/interleukin-1 receptor domain-containing protein [Chloroflexota bacterium]